VDVVDQIRASYSSQSRSYKWWHRIFWAMLDITEVNMYIIYLHACRGRPEEVPTPMTHLEFKNALCEALLLGWRQWKEVNNETLTHRPSIHMPSHSTSRRPCVVCGIYLPHTYCLAVWFQVYVLERRMLSTPSRGTCTVPSVIDIKWRCLHCQCTHF
jgi:hypothetical protein